MSLGFWQLYRLSWKLDLINQIENSLKIDPVELQNVKKQVITYKRADGLELSGILYLPVNYDEEKKEKVI